MTTETFTTTNRANVSFFSYFVIFSLLGTKLYVEQLIPLSCVGLESIVIHNTILWEQKNYINIITLLDKSFHLNYKSNKFDFTTIVARFLAQGLDSCPTIWNLFAASSSHNVIPSLFAVPITRQIWTIVAWAFIFWIVVIWYLVCTCCAEEKSQ